MAKSIGERLTEIRRIVRLHTSWFTVALLGKDAITKEELQELEKYGKLPLDETLDFAKKSYVLGRLRSLLKSSEYKKLNFEEIVEKTDTEKFTTLEEYVLQHVKLHAAEGIKRLADDVAAGAFSRLAEATQQTINEAAVRGIIRDKVELALLEKQNSQKLASTLAKELKTGWNRDWRRVAETELHHAKQMGSAQAIVNKVGVYKNSDGSDSLVSIVPSPDRCDDCGSHFLDSEGNPKVFRLSQLLKQGTNADSKVKHTRSGGLHNHWKTTVPPLHPRCYSKYTDVLTRRGWIPISEITIADKIFSLNPLTRDVEWVSVKQVMSYENEPTLLRFYSRNFDLAVTKDHHMVGLSDWNYKHNREKELTFWHAENTPSSRHLYRSSEWVGELSEFNTFGLTIEEFCVFMGYYLSEGNCHPMRGQINITQFKKDSKQLMWETLSKMPFETCSFIKKGIYIQHKHLWDYLQRFGLSHEKFVPNEIKSLPKKYLKLFWDAYVLGDGCVREGSNTFKGGGFREEVAVSTSSLQMTADLGEIILKLGGRPSYYKEGPRTVKHYNGTYTAKYPQWYVRYCYSQWASVVNMTIEEIPYNDTVYCIELEKFHTLYVRYNNKCTWSGNCGCRLVYIPKGMGWENGKLQVVDEDIYVEELKKAVDKTSLAPTITPPGPKTTSPKAPTPTTTPSVKTSASPPSMAGAPAPGNVPGPGKPKSAVDPLAKTTLADDMSPCPFGGGDECKSHGGNGAKHHKSDGAIMEAHRKSMQQGAVPADPAAAQADKAREEQEAKNWNKTTRPHTETLSHLSNGEFAEVKDIKDGMSSDDIAEARARGAVGINDAFKVRIKDNGSAMMKPSPSDDRSTGDLGNCPAGRHHEHEAASYDYSLMMGLDSHVPPTSTREYNGQEHSMQQWLEGYNPLGATMGGGNLYKAALNAAPADKKDALKKKMDEIICLDLVSNNGDSHGDQWMISEDFSDVRKIDNGVAFGNSMMGTKVSMHWHATVANAGSGGFKLPEHMQERWKNMSFGDLQRGLGGRLQDWQVGQQFMRQQYLLHLQKTEGTLDPNKFLPTWPAGDESFPAHSNMWSKVKRGIDVGTTFSARDAERQLPHQLFEDFSKAWIEEAKNDPKSEFHGTAKQLDEIGIFMPPNSMNKVNEIRQAGKHREYEKNKVKANKRDEPLALITHTEKGVQDILAQLSQQQKEYKESKRPIPETRTATEAQGSATKKGLRLYLDLTK
jgi:hypothetical protein